MDAIFADLRHALRLLAARRTYTIAALLALGLGIGANTALFSVFDAVLLDPLPYPDADRLVRLWERNPEKGIEGSRISPVLFADLRRDASSFAGLTGWWVPSLNLTSGEGEPERVRVVNATDDFFDVLGVRPIHGRGFLPGEDEPGRPSIAVLGHGLFQRRFGGDPGVVGRTVELDGVGYQVVGVAAPDFDFPDGTEVWLPLGWVPADHYRGARFFHAVARLAPGVDAAAAQAELDRLTERYGRDHPETAEGWSAAAVTLRDDLVGSDVRSGLWVLLGAVALVLAIACANVANLLLAQGAARGREVAVRGALGASRGRLLRQLLTESLVLGVGGGLLGLVLAWVGTRLLLALAPPEIPRLDGVAVDVRVLAFTFLVAVMASLFFGLLPAWQTSRAPSAEALKDGSRGLSGGLQGSRLRGLLVIAEVALALMLLVGAGLLVRSFQTLLARHPGFTAERVVSFNLQLPRAGYGEWTDVTAFYDRLVERLEDLPGVRDATVTGFLPLERGWPVDFVIADRAGLSELEQPEAQYRPVGPGYFQLLGVPLLAGRDFAPADTADAPGVVILNRTAVARYWPDEDPVGQRITGQGRQFGPLGRVLTESLEAEIVGVVGDVRNVSLEGEVEPAIYFPQSQFAYRSMFVLTRVVGEPKTMLETVKQGVWSLDPELPVADLETLEGYLGEALARRRFIMLLLACLAGLALSLAAIGTYGVMAWVAGQRRREMGIRIALGARPGDVTRLIVGQGLALAGIGIAVGLAGALVLRRAMGSLVYGISTADPATLAAVAALLAAAAFLACYLPARRASRADPVRALRAE